MLHIDDFFVGIGDINSAFLPKIQPLAPVIPPPMTADPDGPEPTVAEPDAEDDDDSDLEDDLLDSEAPSSPAGENDLAELEKDEMLTRNTLALEAQFEERPLAKEQEKLQKTAEEATDKTEQNPSAAEPPQNGDAPSDAEQKKEKPVRKALLKNDDTELERVKKVRRGLLCSECCDPTVAEDPRPRSRALLCCLRRPEIRRRAETVKEETGQAAGDRVRCPGTSELAYATSKHAC